MTFDYEKACEYIDKAASLGSRPGLGRIERLCAIMGDPQNDMCFIHVAGTNGKGSTCAMISSALSAAGLHVGMYYSPAITCIHDHFVIDGTLISKDEYAQCVSAVYDANEKLIKECGESATMFELETALAFYFFRKNNCDLAVIECGMGGAEDATNIIRNKICCVITSVSFDHMQYLGDTIEKIASVKAGIITSDCPVIAFDSSEEAIGAIRNRCMLTGSPLYVVTSSDADAIAGMKLSLRGTFQKENAATAKKVLDVIRDKGLIPNAPVDDAVIAKAFANVRWPFRFEKIADDPPVFVDGAHNADAAVKLADTIREELEGYSIILVMGMFADKEYEKVVATLSDIAGMIITTQTADNPRALDANLLAKCAGAYHKNVSACPKTEDAYYLAVDTAKSGKEKAAVIACGSLSYLNEFRGYVHGKS